MGFFPNPGDYFGGLTTLRDPLVLSIERVLLAIHWIIVIFTTITTYQKVQISNIYSPKNWLEETKPLEIFQVFNKRYPQENRMTVNDFNLVIDANNRRDLHYVSMSGNSLEIGYQTRKL